MSPGELTLHAAGMRVVCDPGHGGAIMSVVDEATAAEALWRRPRPDPDPPTRSLGPGGAASVPSFIDRFGGGWFEMAPAVGFPADDDPAGLLHGEACRLPWTVTDQAADRLTLGVDLVRTPLHVRKQLTIDADGVLRVVIELHNRGAMAVPYALGTHPCFARETFAGGEIRLAVQAAAVPAPPLVPRLHRLAPGTAVTWPLARAADGSGTIDVARIPSSPTGTSDHVCITPSRGEFTLTAPRHRRALTVAFGLDVLPHLLLWQDFRAPGGYSFWGDADVFALEPSSNPGRDARDLLAAGAQRTLEPGDRTAAELELRWHDLD